MKKTLISFVFMLVIVIPAGAFAAGAATAPAPAATTPAATAPAAGSATANSSANPTFTPLTNIPGLTDSASGNPTLPKFLDNLYKICIGIAVVLAVLQLIRAGVTYMTAAGSVGSTEQAKHLISTAILGLVLVLSPYIVFSVINPSILSLNIGADSLKTNAVVAPTPADNAKAVTSGNLQQGETITDCPSETNCDAPVAACNALPGGGSSSYVCKDSSGNVTSQAWLSGNCDTGQHHAVKCTPNIAISKKCPQNDKTSCPVLSCPSGTNETYKCVSTKSAVLLDASLGANACSGDYVLMALCQ